MASFCEKPAADAAAWTLLTLAGMPPAACALIWANPNGSIHHADVYASLSDPLSQTLIFAGTLHTPEAIVVHELRHVFGERHVLFPFIDRCETQG